MFPALIFITLITFGGFALTYLFAYEENFLWRVCAGNIVGSAIFGLVVFLLACFFGLTTATVVLSCLICLAPLILFANKTRRAKFNDDWRAAKTNLEGADFRKLSRVAYYLFFLLLFYFFFDRAMLETAREFSPARQTISAICRFTWARFFRSPTGKIFRRKILLTLWRNFPIRL